MQTDTEQKRTRKKPSASAVDRKPNDAHHHGNLKEAVVETALILLRERQSADFTLREVAGLIGVQHSAVYRHFSNKDELLAEIALRGFETLDAMQLRVLAKAGQDPLQRLMLTHRGYVRFALMHRGAFFVMFDPSMHAHWSASPRIKAARDRGLDTLKATVAACVGSTPPSESSLAVLVSLTWSSVHGLAQLLASGHLAWLTSGSKAFERRLVSLAAHVAAVSLQAAVRLEEQAPSTPRRRGKR